MPYMPIKSATREKLGQTWETRRNPSHKTWRRDAMFHF